MEMRASMNLQPFIILPPKPPKPPSIEYTTTIITDGNGTATAIPSTAITGTEITLIANANEGYRFNQWEVISGSITISNDKFTMPAENVEVKATFSEIVPVDVQWIDAIQVGGISGSADTLKIKLTFSKEIPALTSGNFSIEGATAGTLTDKENGFYDLEINNITVADSANITITVTNPIGFNITPISKEVQVFRNNISITIGGGGIQVDSSFSWEEEHPDIEPPQRTFQGNAFNGIITGLTKDNFTSSSGEIVYYSDEVINNHYTSFELGLNNVTVFSPNEFTITVSNPPGYVIQNPTFKLSCNKGVVNKGAPGTTTFNINTVFKDSTGTVIEPPEDFGYYMLIEYVNNIEYLTIPIMSADNYTGIATVMSSDVENTTFRLSAAVSGWTSDITNDGLNYTVTFTSTTPPTKLYKTMTVNINENSNYDDDSYYSDDATNMTAGSDEFDEFIGHYPCVLKNGVEGKKINPNDFTKYVDGTGVSITDGDVMIAFPVRGIKITKNTESNLIICSVTDEPNKDGYSYLAHTDKNNVVKDKIYIGAYEGLVRNSMLCSVRDGTPFPELSVSQLEEKATANGDGYDLFSWWHLIYIQVLYLLKYKKRNSQTTIGYGLTSASTITDTGSADLHGMDNQIALSNPNNTTKNTDGLLSMKLFGIENLWGNIPILLKNIKFNFNKFPTDMMQLDITYPDKTTKTFTTNIMSNFNGFVVHSECSNELGFILSGNDRGNSGSAYCDAQILEENCSIVQGGSKGIGVRAGVFCMTTDSSIDDIDYFKTGRLVYV